jgi:CRISPR-associated endonuclease/helicase Cas3
MSRDAEMTWSPGSLPGDVHSHPDRLLKDHLEGTAELALELARKHGLPVESLLLRRVAFTHDLEKAHPLFQDYLLKKRGKGVNHAFHSSCFTLDTTRNLWAAEAVRCHHTHLDDADTACRFWIKREDDLAELQSHMREIVPSWKFLVTQEEWEDFIDDLWEVKIGKEDWLSLRSLYSLLVTADRMDAIGVSSLDFDPLPKFSPMNFGKEESTPLDGWRQSVHDDCMKNAGNIDGPGLYTLTLPTGAGKTTVGLEMAHRLATKWGYGTIIYALPFISIIEQNASVAKTLFGKDSVQEDHSRAYGELTDDNGAKENSWARMSALFRYWRTPVVLTTMVQLWDAIFDPRANASMDFHRLSRAVVVLDEPQGIDPRLWDGFGRMLSFLSEKWGTAFILMTATQPHIGEGREIAPPDLDFPYNRHTYSVLPGKHSLDELPELLCDKLSVDDGSGLIVLNTKKSALKIYQLLRDRLDGPVLFLSAWMAPRHRRRIMRYLRYLEKKGNPRRKGIRHHLISTQVVEAGVDLDFDWVFRDMGPLDSVIQVAGRCNRHLNRDDPGNVLVAELTGGNGRSFCGMVYDDILLANSRDILAEEKSFGENQVPSLVKRYYDRILEGLSYKPVWRNIEKGKWGQKEDLIKKEDERRNETVFVELDRHIRPILERLCGTKWSLERLDEKKRLVRQAQQYLIEVPLKELMRWQEKVATVSTNDNIPLISRYGEEEYWFIARAAMGIIYDRVTGFVPADMYDGSDLDDPFI